MSLVGRQQLRVIEWKGVDTEQSRLSDVARVAMVTNLLTEDNLPSYHRTIAEYFTIDDVWGHG